MHKLFRHITANNTADLSGFTPLVVDGKALGFLHPDIAGALEHCEAVKKDGAAMRLVHDDAFESRNADFKIILAHLIEKKFIAKERFELYSVAENFGDTPLALADRALMPMLGLASCGIHCNGYVGEGKNIRLWIGCRAATSAVDPGKLDHIVAGGQPHGLTLRENLLKESREEACIPPHLVAAAKPVGAIRYNKAIPHGVRRDTLFLFDLPLPHDFTPQNQDGETSSFELMPVEQVRKLLEEGDHFKFNVPLVLIDFLIRHGLIEADEPGYAELASGLHAAI